MPLYQPSSPIINMQKYFKHTGFTLIELIIVIVLVGILVAGSSNLLTRGFKSHFVSKDIINANWQGNVALERMVRDLRAVRSTTDITAASASSLTIVDLDGNTITYQTSGSKLRRGSHYIADNIQSITFNYYTSATPLTEVVPPTTQATRATIRYIKITLNMNYNNLTFPIKAAVYLWNLK